MGTVNIGVPNDGEISLSVNVVEKWEISDIKEIGEVVFFKSDDSFFSMKKVDYIKIFK